MRNACRSIYQIFTQPLPHADTGLVKLLQDHKELCMKLFKQWCSSTCIALLCTACVVAPTPHRHTTKVVVVKKPPVKTVIVKPVRVHPE